MDEKKIDETRLDQRCSDAGHWHFAFFDSARAVRSRTGRSGKPSALILTWWREKRNRCTCAFEIALLRSWTNEYIHWKKYSLTVFISVWFWISKNRFLEHRFILMWILWDTNYWRHLLKWFCHWEHMEKYSRFAYYFEWRVGRGDLSMLVMQVAVFDNDVDDCVDFVG